MVSSIAGQYALTPPKVHDNDSSDTNKSICEMADLEKSNWVILA